MEAITQTLDNFYSNQGFHFDSVEPTQNLSFGNKETNVASNKDYNNVDSKRSYREDSGENQEVYQKQER